MPSSQALPSGMFPLPQQAFNASSCMKEARHILCEATICHGVDLRQLLLRIYLNEWILPIWNLGEGCHCGSEARDSLLDLIYQPSNFFTLLLCPQNSSEQLI